jgi:hypothetical protein
MEKKMKTVATHKQKMPPPCAECPFRKKSLPGWIGGHQHVGEIINIVQAGQKFPCHTQVNRFMEIDRDEGRKPDFDDACRLARTCVGGLHFLANSACLPRHPYAAMQVKIVGKNPAVFGSRREMVGHHEKFAKPAARHNTGGEE